ncbi:MAG: metallophosphoesterase [Oscillospiraceae bacterium]|nr:metallophosphoesterase [Oscillospiraceae bacterium]
MKKILVFSDTHGYTDPCMSIIEKNRPSVIIHAGDCTGDAEDLSYIYPDIPIYYVKGNNDFFSSAAMRMTVIIDGVRIFITHGHEQRVKYESDYRTLRAAAKEADASLIIFGHTHIPYTSYDYGVTMINPGSVRFSGTYAVVEIEKGKVNTKILDI